LQFHEAEITRGAELVATGFHQGTPLHQLLRRPDVNWIDLCQVCPAVAALGLSPLAGQQLVLEAKYAGYIRRQQSSIEQQDQVQSVAIPEQFNYSAVPQLRAEAKQKLARIQPRNLGQASRISGITPADIAILMLYVREPHRLAL
jgi:tRNA uridine 5-carboxymethylaminomethyl modification enzyme